MLTSALDQYREQQRIAALAVREGQRVATRGSLAVASVLSSYQLAAAASAFESTPMILAEQGIEAPPEGTARLSSLLTGQGSVQMIGNAANQSALDLLLATLVTDAARTAMAVDLGRRPALSGHVRSLSPPSCSRCAVLAGRVYRWSDGFKRHPGCDCQMTLTTEAIGKDLVTDVNDLLARDRSMVRGLSKADYAALNRGADLGRVVNVRRSGAGLKVGSSVMQRAGRLTPQGVLWEASSRPQALRLLRNYGYIT